MEDKQKETALNKKVAQLAVIVDEKPLPEPEKKEARKRLARLKKAIRSGGSLAAIGRLIIELIEMLE